MNRSFFLYFFVATETILIDYVDLIIYIDFFNTFLSFYTNLYNKNVEFRVIVLKNIFIYIYIYIYIYSIMFQTRGFIIVN